MAVDTIVYVVFYGSRTVPMLGLSSNFSTFKCLLKPLPSLEEKDALVWSAKALCY